MTQYESAPGVCTALTVCSETHYESVPASPTSNRTCSLAKVCNQGQYMTLEKTPTTNRQCAPCAGGSFSITTNAAKCEPWTECDADQVQLSTPSAVANRTCGLGSGACCDTHAEPGCSDQATQECVCGLLPECCSGTWDAPCALIVQGQYCEAGVRECVCTDWGQNQCCDTSWSSFCQTTADAKCGASGGCY